MNITVAEMKANLSEILRKAAEGKEITVTKHGKPYVKIEGTKPKQTLPRLGAFKGQGFWIADDFDELGPEWDEYTKS